MMMKPKETELNKTIRKGGKEKPFIFEKWQPISILVVLMCV
jgi:hypothetical protein